MMKLKTYARCVVKLELALLDDGKGTTAQGSPVVQAAARNPRLATHVLQQGCILHISQRLYMLTVGKVPSHCLLGFAGPDHSAARVCMIVGMTMIC